MTIKLRLTLLFITVVALILAVLMISLYEYASYQRSTEFANQLFARALTAATVALESDEMSPHAIEPFRKTLSGYQLPEESIAIFDSSNAAVFRSGVHTLTINPAKRRLALSGRGFASLAGDTQAVFLPYEDNGQLFVVEVSAMDTAGLRSLNRVGLGLIAGFAISIGAVGVAGWWFASRAMKPIARTTRQAERISATDLNIRLDEGNGTDEISKLAHAFNAMLERLERAFLWQRQFIANASHEIRTPLTTLEGSLEVALMLDRSGEEYRAVLGNALDDTRRLRILVNDLLLLARAESEASYQQRELIRLDDILLSVLEELHPRYLDRVVDVQIQTPNDDAEALQVLADSGLLRVVIENVLENALKYSGGGLAGPVHVRIEGDADSIRLNVANRGPGIPERDLPHVFSPFYRGGNVRKIRGNGIGLALVKTIVEQHHGTVELRSIEGGWTTMEVRLATPNI